jgi:hypothetical protein
MYFIFSLGIQPRAHARGLLLFLIKALHRITGRGLIIIDKRDKDALAAPYRDRPAVVFTGMDPMRE